MAVLALAAVGSMIGTAAFGGGVVALGLTAGQIGWAVGAAIGSAFGPKQKTQGPRLTDLIVTGTEYGQAIPYCVGKVRTAGQIIWSSERRETATTHEEGKGGGSEFTEYSYDVDLLILLTENEILGVSRVWSNGELVYDGTTTKENLWTRLTVYTGAADQLPDPTYEAAVGSAVAPAYRGRGSVFIEGLQLGSSGNLPNLTFELASSVDTGIVLDVAGSAYDDASSYNRSPTVDTSNPGTIDASGAYIEMITGANETYSDFVYWPYTVGLPAITGTADLDVEFWLDSTKPRCFLMRSPWISIELVRTTGPTLYHLRVINEVEHTSHLTSGTGTIVGLFSMSEWHTLSVRWNGRLPVCTIDGGQVALTDGGAGTWGTGHSRFEVGAFYREDGAAEEKRLLVRNLVVTVAAEGGGDDDCTALSDVVADLCERCGLSAGDYDTSDLVTASSPGFSAVVCAFYISDVSPTRSALEVLMSAYAFDCAKSDKLYFRFRQTSSVATVAFEDLDASEPGSMGEPLQLTFANELEIPSQMAVSYRNLDSDFQVATEFSDRLLSGQESTNIVQLPLGLHPAEARKIADIMLYEQVAGLVRTSFSLPMAYAAIEPTDVITVENDDGRSYRVRIVSRKEGGNILRFDAVVDESAISSLIEQDADAGLVDTDYPSQTQVTNYALSVWEMLDIPLLRDADDAPGWYAAAKKLEGASGTWPGAALLVSADEVSYTLKATFTGANVFGTCQTSLGNWNGGSAWDEANTVTVDVGSGELSSSTRDAMHADSSINVMLIGEEVIRFRLATLLSLGVYRLSGLLRGQRGTEWAMADHGAGSPAERVVLLSTNLRRAGIESSEIGTQRFWKAITTGKAVSSADYEAETNTGVCLKPFAPVNLRTTVDASTGAVTYTWDRRTRLLAENCLEGLVPVGEQSEEYEVELLDEDDEVILSDTVTEAQWTPSSSGGVLGIELVTCAWALQFVGGELYGIPEETLAGTGSRRVTRFDQANGAILAQSASLGATVNQTALVGTSLVLVCNSYNGVGAVSEGAVRRVLLSDLSIAAEYIAPDVSDPAGIAYDGAKLWLTERISGKVRELNPTTLASVADYALEVGIEACFYDSGSLYIVSAATQEIIEWDVTSHTEVTRWSCVAYPFDVRVLGSLIFVQGMSQVGVYNLSGVPQAYHTLAANGIPQRMMVPYGSDLAVLNQGSGGAGSTMKVLSASTGLELDSIPSPYYRTLMISGDTTGRLWVAGQPDSSSLTLASATLGGVAPDADGALLRVYQMSATVGRGYVAQLSLE